MESDEISGAEGTKSGIDSIDHLSNFRKILLDNEALIESLQKNNSEMTNVADSINFNIEEFRAAADLLEENHELRAEIAKFMGWFETISVASSKTTYGEMLIYAYDRVQCSRVIPEINYEEHLLSDIIKFLSSEYNFSCVNFIDIGSNIGTQSTYMLKMNLARKVIAFEPDPNNYKLLRCNFIINDIDDRATAVNSALGDFDGIVEFELSKDNMGDHRVRLQEYGGWVQNEQYRDVIKVEMKCPRTALLQYDLDYSKTLVWLDAQGLEGHILTSFLKDGQYVKYFVCEYWPYGIECASGREKFFQVMEQCETIYDIRNMDAGAALTLDYLRSYYDEAVALEANHKVFSIDLLCIVKDPENITLPDS